MKTVLNAIGRIISHSSIAFTAAVVFFWLFMSENSNQNAMEYGVITMLLEFGLVFGATSLIKFIPMVPRIVKILLHFGINAVSFALFFNLFGSLSQATAFVAIVVFALCYALVTVALLLLEKLADKVSKRKNAEDIAEA